MANQAEALVVTSGAPKRDRVVLGSALIVWVLAVTVTPLFLSDWAPLLFVGVWTGVHSVAYWLYMLGPLGRDESWYRAARMATSVIVWGSIPISAIASGDYAEHEPLVLLVTAAFVSIRAFVIDTRRIWEVDGLVVGVTAAACSLIAGRTAFGVATLATAVFYLLAERGQLARHEQARRDRQAVREAMRTMTDLAHVDQLTGLGNRRAAIEWLAAQPPGPAVGLLLDIDDFKVVNDRYGHQAGDAVLVQTAATVQARLSAGWHLFRLGGDEFIAFSRDPGHAFSDELDRIDVDSLAYDGTPVVVETAISGGTSVLEFPVTLDGAMAALSPALRRAKRETGSAIVAASPDLVEDDVWTFSMRAIEALESKEFTWWGQPIIDLASGDPVAVELLCRWHDHDGPIASPTEFLGALSIFQRLRTLGRQNIAAIADWLDALDTAGFDQLEVQWNVPPSHIAGGLVADLDEMLDRSRWHRVAIEVLESEVLDVNATVIAAVDELRSCGVSVLIDDFGAGHSSFRLLSEFSFDGVKIDRGFVSGVDTHPRRAAVIDGIAPVLANLGVATVAEGVETAGEFATVRNAGVNRVQGWYIARAQPLEACLATLARLRDEADL